MSQKLAELTKNNKVLIFSVTGCPFCLKTKTLFKETLNIEYKDVNVREEEGAQEIFAEVTKQYGHETFPAVFVNGTFVGGNSDVQEAHTNGKLKTLLGQ